MVIFELKRSNKLKLLFKKERTYEFDISNEYSKFYSNFRKKLKDENFNKIFKKYFNKNDKLLMYYLNYFYLGEYYKLDLDNSIYIEFIDTIKKINLENYKSKIVFKSNKTKEEVNIKNKESILISTMLFYDDIKDIDYLCDREKVNSENLFYNYLICYDKLKKGGDLIIKIFNICNSETLNIIYIGLLLFKNLSIYCSPDFSIYLYYRDFNPSISKSEYKKIYNKNFMIEGKEHVDKLMEFVYNEMKNQMKLLKALSENRIDDFLTILVYVFLSKIEYNKNDKNINEFYKYIFKYFKKIFIDKELINVHSNISLVEGSFLNDLIKKNNFKKCLEVGMAFGISAFYMLSALDGKGELISLDPFQKTQWKSYGIKLLKSVNLDKNHKLIEKKSYVALPELLEKNEGKFDFIFIDGWHTFDYTLLDFFYSNLLLRKKGIIVIDDALHSGVKKCVKYIDTNFKNYKRIYSPKTQAAYIKLSDDKREWNFHRDF